MISNNDNKIWFLLFGIILFSSIPSLFLDVMEIDAAQYASIAREMSENKSFLEVYHRNEDYLDKPPLLFWLSSISFLIFGVSNFAYKFPSFLIAILGVYSTYRFAKLWYKENTAKLAALVLASCQAYFLMTNDVKTDTNLLGFTIFSIWQISSFLKYNKTKYLVFAGFGIGLSMLAKGPIGAMVPVLAIFSHLILTKQWNLLLNVKWTIVPFIAFLVLSPMLWGLYHQFDLHPEKNVYGLDGPSGIKFFFWTQSFGRLTGDIYWKNDTPWYFFITTILWDFQPWVLLFFYAFTKETKRIIKLKSEEYISFFGFLLPFIALSFSSFKLPHYIFILFPFASVLTAKELEKLSETRFSIISKIHIGVLCLFVLAPLVSGILFFDYKSYVNLFVSIILFGLGCYCFFKMNTSLKIVASTTAIICGFNFFMNTEFYPSILKYQSSAQAAHWINAKKIEENVYWFETHGDCLDFYLEKTIPYAGPKELKSLTNGSIIYTNSSGLKKLDKIRGYNILKKFKRFPVSTLKIDYLLKEKRDITSKDVFLIELI